MGAHTSGDDTRAVLDAVRRIVHGLRESSRRAEKHVGLSGAQLFVLHKLAESPALSLNELAALTHTHQSSVSTVVARLEAAGLVRRAWSTADGRRLELSLTHKGRQLAERAPDMAQERLIAAIEAMPATRRRQLASGLTEVARALDSSAATPAMFFEERPPRLRRSAR
jgi:DNA-binding MarR family transcriptional regulator